MSSQGHQREADNTFKIHSSVKLTRDAGWHCRGYFPRMDLLILN